LKFILLKSLRIDDYFPGIEVSIDHPAHESLLMTNSKFMPYQYFQTVLEVNDLNLTWQISLLGIRLLMVVLAWFWLLKRDIRLNGEGSWKLRFFLKPKRA